MLREEKKELEKLRKKYHAHFSLDRKKRGPTLTTEERQRFHYLNLCENKSLRRDYGPLWDWLNGILYRHDVERLCLDSQQYDEYEPEVKRILPELRKLYKKKQIKTANVEKVLRKIHLQMFSFPSSKADYPAGKFDAMAQEITDFLNGKEITISIESIKGLDFLKEEK